VVPWTEASFDGQCTLLLSDSRSSFSYKGQIWNEPAGRYVPRDHTSAFNGVDSKQLIRKVTREQYPRGIVRKSKQNIAVKSLRFRPLMWYLRPFDTTMGGFDKKDLKLTTVIDDIDGAPCPVMQAKGWELWIDPRTYLIRKASITELDGSPSVLMEIQYEAPTSKGDCALKGWTLKSMRGDSVRTQTVSSSPSLKHDVPVAKDAFEISFPAGTWVVDESGATEKQYLVRENGGQRAITDRDLGKSYEALIATDPDRAKRND